MAVFEDGSEFSVSGSHEPFRMTSSICRLLSVNLSVNLSVDLFYSTTTVSYGVSGIVLGTFARLE